MKTTRHLYFEEPGAPAGRASVRAAQANTPLRVRALGAPSSLSLSASPSTIVYGRSSVLSGRLVGPVVGGRGLRVFRSGAPVGSTSTASGGGFTLRARP